MYYNQPKEAKYPVVETSYTEIPKGKLTRDVHASFDNLTFATGARRQAVYQALVPMVHELAARAVEDGTGPKGNSYALADEVIGEYHAVREDNATLAALELELSDIEYDVLLDRRLALNSVGSVALVA